jgi:hypothetical protein
MKCCRKCNLTKELGEFNKRARAKDGYQTLCRNCQKIYWSGQYTKNKQNYIDKTDERRRNRLSINRALLHEYLREHPCVDCGNTNPVVLEFDHVDRSNKAYQISDMIGNYKWEAIVVEIAKCEVRCANCHKIRTAQQFGWYSNKPPTQAN